MSGILSDAGMDLIFRQARTHRSWQDKPVSPVLLQATYDLAKMGPTSSNCCPMRVVFVVSPEAKERLRPALAKGNLERTMRAPATAIIAYDTRFYEALPRLSPDRPGRRDSFAASPELSAETAFRNGSLQGAYVILAARALGLDCGPMSGFDRKAMDREFFGDGGWRSNFLCNIGYGQADDLHPRQPRLDFDDACRIL
jgi:3-hydroxypropanoate dehydrogenase